MAVARSVQSASRHSLCDRLNLADLAGQIADDVLATIGVKRDELADKLRQPLGELVADKKIHTGGERRLMKYHAGPKK